MITNSFIPATIDLTRQAGDTGSIVVIVPLEVVDLPTFEEVIFQVYRAGVCVLDLRLSDSNGLLTIDGQAIVIELEKGFMSNYKGVNKYELQVSKNPLGQVITLQNGTLTILKELITVNE